MRSLIIKSILLLFPILLIGCAKESAVFEKHIPDDRIKSQVESFLLLDSQLPDVAITADVNGGSVKLNGTVTNFRELHRVVADVKKVAGVKDIVNNLKVVPGVRGDDLILDDVRNAIKRNAELQNAAVVVKVKNGEVTLTGKVSSYLQKQLAQGVAENTYGTRNVENDLTVVPAKPRSDSQIKADIEHFFKLDRLVHSNIMVDVKDGVVTLTGQVKDFGEMDSALEDASLATGVRDVVNHMTLAP